MRMEKRKHHLDLFPQTPQGWVTGSGHQVGPHQLLGLHRARPHARIRAALRTHDFCGLSCRGRGPEPDGAESPPGPGAAKGPSLYPRPRQQQLPPPRHGCSRLCKGIASGPSRSNHSDLTTMASSLLHGI